MRKYNHTRSRCARDVQDGLTSLGCQPLYGSYTHLQSLSSYEMCVDSDGVQISGKYPLTGDTGQKCNIDGFGDICDERWVVLSFDLFFIAFPFKCRRDECADNPGSCDNCIAYCIAPP